MGVDLKECRIHKEKPNKTVCEFFEIGLGRTGSRSVAQAVKNMGIDIQHGLARCEECEKDVALKTAQGRYDFALYSYFEYSGNVAHVHWKQLVEAFPQSKFILTMRPIKDWLDAWENKRSAHRRNMERFKKSLGQEFPLTWGIVYQLKMFGMVGFNRNVWGHVFERHNHEVREYFGPSDRLLVLNVFEQRSQDIWNQLGKFIGREPLKGDFPHIHFREKIQ